MDVSLDILKNLLLRETHARQRSELKKVFPELRECSHDHFLSLHKYLTRSPNRFFSHTIYSDFLSWLNERQQIKNEEIQKYFLTHNVELNSAIIHLEEINSLDWHDHFEQLDDYELIRFIDRQIHPTYLRLIEAVIMPIAKIVAYFTRLDRGKGTENLDLWAVVQELGRSELSNIIASYKHIVRNGIAHGGITFLQKEIRYRDKKGNEEKFSDREIIQTFDEMLDTCNALVLAVSVFLIIHRSSYSLLQQLLINELRAETNSPWWEIVGCVPSEFAGNKQLIIYARPLTFDFGKVQLSAFQSGVLAEQFAPGFDRYFVSIRASFSWPGWAVFDGVKLHELRQKKGVRLEDYKGVLQDDLVFFVPHYKMPRLLSKLHTYVISFKIKWPIVMVDLRKQLGWPEIIVREAKIHRNTWGSVLNGSVFVHLQDDEVTQEVIRNFRKRIVRKALSEARRRTSLLSLTRHVPLGFALISVFRRDYRRRNLANFGLREDLICTIRVQYLGKIDCGDIFESTVEQISRYRIAWNKAWLETIVA